MKKKEFKENIKGILIGLVIFIVNAVIIQAISKVVFNYLYYQQPLDQLATTMTNSSLLSIPGLLRLLPFLSALLAGLITGWIVKKNGWIYSAVSACLFSLLNIGYIYVSYNSSYGLPSSVLSSQIGLIPIIISLATIGGYIGGKLAKRS